MIRRAESSDLKAITDIYNDAIRTTTATFDMQPKTREEQAAWFTKHGPQHPILVAEVEGVVAGWASLSPWSDRCAYNATAETSFYVGPDYRGCGVGRQLKSAIIDAARQLGYHTLIARAAEGSAASMHLNEAFGFRHVGVLKEVGRKFDEWVPPVMP